MAKILVADDHPILRAGLRQTLGNFLTNPEIFEVENFKKLLQIVEANVFDLVIMDIDMPGGNSVKMIETFKNKWPRIPVLMISGYDESLYALAFVKAGADGYISKDASEGEFKTAVESVLFAKKLYLSEAIREESFRMFMRTGRGLEESQISLSIRVFLFVLLFISCIGV